MKKLFRKALIVFAFVAGTTAAFAQHQLPQLPTDPQVRIGKLDNGLTYYIRHNALPKKQAEFYIAQKVLYWKMTTNADWLTSLNTCASTEQSISPETL